MTMEYTDDEISGRSILSKFRHLKNWVVEKINVINDKVDDIQGSVVADVNIGYDSTSEAKTDMKIDLLDKDGEIIDTKTVIYSAKTCEIVTPNTDKIPASIDAVRDYVQSNAGKLKKIDEVVIDDNDLFIYNGYNTYKVAEVDEGSVAFLKITVEANDSRNIIPLQMKCFTLTHSDEPSITDGTYGVCIQFVKNGSDLLSWVVSTYTTKVSGFVGSYDGTVPKIAKIFDGDGYDALKNFVLIAQHTGSSGGMSNMTGTFNSSTNKFTFNGADSDNVYGTTGTLNFNVYTYDDNNLKVPVACIIANYGTYITVSDCVPLAGVFTNGNTYTVTVENGVYSDLFASDY